MCCLFGKRETSNEAEQAALQIRTALTGDWKIGKMPVMVNFSIGVAVASAAGETISSILKRADEAMYKNKGFYSHKRRAYGFFRVF
ncbi:diguanylate cyclase [Planococcus sp. ISL-109]|uniref:diguanylate cyclase domain-containing protein n=1 Tax=Planococcus sp. ISL-109 TaxID=2819166 RepID=UPI001BE5BF1E|nr:diguanylate cyclase [Planococcus sp. ISL-109]